MNERWSRHNGGILTRGRCRQTLGVALLLIGFLLSAPCAGCAAGQFLSGKATKIIDGDSVIVRRNGRNYEIRLWGIDCPEYNQPYGAAAEKLTRRLAGTGSVRVAVKSKDSYGRMVGVLYRGSLNVNEELVRQGAAWVYDQYCQEAICREWRRLETAAGSGHLGLWAHRNPVPPWKWRRRK